MRKILLSLAALLTAGVAWAQTEVASKGEIKSAEQLMAMTEATNIVIQNISGTNRWYFAGNKNIENYAVEKETWFVWEPSEESGKFYLKKRNPTDAKSEGYLQSAASGANITIGAKATAQKFKAVFAAPQGDNTAPTQDSDAEKLVRFIKADQESVWINCQGTTGTPKYNSGTGGWTMHNVYAINIEEVTSFTVKYSFKYNGKEVATQSVEVMENSDYPAITISLPYGITATKPEGTVSADDAVEGVVTKEIVLAKEKDLPFETAATADEITKWYYMRMHTNQPGFIGDIAEDNTINVAWGKTAEENTMDNFLWGFVGSDAFGITVVNKGTGKQLVSTGDGNVTLTDAGTSFFVANTGEKTNKAKYGFCLRKSDSNNYINANYGAKKLSHWSSADAGSTIFVYEEETSAEVTVSDAGYATVCIDYPVSIPENVEVYTVTTVEGSSAKMTKIEGVLPENTGVIVKAAAGDYDFSISALPVSATNGNLLKGTVVDTDVTAEANTTYYVLSNPENGPVGFYKAALTDNKFKNKANKAYLPITNQTESSARFLSFDFGTETAIESIEGAEVESAVVYDLSGRRVQKAQKGLYIVNGKKVVK